MSRPIINMSGLCFGRLTVMSLSHVVRGRGGFWLCHCDCGGTVVVRGDILRGGASRSCGCLNRELSVQRCRAQFTSHGNTRRQKPTPEYNSWQHMKRRCLNPAHPRYADYGGRGITICERWMDFSAFLADVGKKPGPDYTIERIDNNGNYEPGNCRWASRIEQNENRRSSRPLEWRGETRLLNDWGKLLGIDRRTLAHRLKAGWSIDKAFSTPVAK